MIPVNRHVTTERENKVVVGKTVTPTEAVEDRAKSELNDAIQDDIPHVSANIKGSSRKTIASSELGIKKRSSSVKGKRKKEFTTAKKRKTVQKLSRKKEDTKNHKRKLSQISQFSDDEKNIFAKRWRT